ncbi:MAG: hypothetical protein JWM06_2275, partial [Actinomycetia bacterium]|nr:hypothetical protein [Actinomycetes bacterium]
DWLELLALPLAVTAGPVWFELRKGGVHARERIALVLLSLAFVFVSVGAYVWHWKWAGFDGNKLWDWLSLWLLPLLVPLVLLPALLSAVGTGEDEADAGASPTAGR